MATPPTRVLHLVGSPTTEFFAELSRLYARDCLGATADAERWDFVIAHVEPGGMWRFPADLDHDTIAASAPMDLAGAISHIVSLGPDVMIPQMFCVPGMTHYRALFDTLGIPYVGNRPDAMAATADKATARAIVAAAGVPVPDGEVVTRGGSATVALPVVVKPVDSDNSVGVTLVRDSAELASALESAWQHGDRALVERYVELGREVRCGVVERDGELVALPLEEYAMDRDSKPVRDAADKLQRDDDGDIRLMAKESTKAWMVDGDDPVVERVHEVALACSRALGCRHYGLFDFRIDPDGEPWFLEAGLYCSFATTSVISMMAAHAGIELNDLFGDLVDLTVGEQT